MTRDELVQALRQCDGGRNLRQFAPVVGRVPANRLGRVMIKRIDHIAIVVDDIDAALNFWRDTLGLELTAWRRMP